MKSSLLCYIFSCCSCILFAQQHPYLNTLIQAENNFATMAGRSSVRQAFLANLDSTSAMYTGKQYENGFAVWTSNKEDTSLQLYWYPAYAIVAAAGDIGITSGPYRMRPKQDDSAAYYGYFFSVWKKNKAGDLKVVFDNGTSVAGDSGKPIMHEKKLTSAADVAATIQDTPVNNTSDTAFVKTDIAFAALAAKDVAHAYGVYADDNCLLLRNGNLACKGKDAAVALWKKKTPPALAYNIAGKGLAASGDLAYVYGEATAATEPAPDGAKKRPYIRVWQYHIAAHAWKLVAEQSFY